ncbi:general substrate transporter [Xylariales sp. PMI_506]|nr:general substrate transporter [Xylariales sp. PMI_506]
MAISIFNKARYFNRTLAYTVALIALSTFNYGFDNQAFSTTQSMTPFVEQFGTYNATTKAYVLETYWLSLFNSLNYISFAIGVGIGSLASSRWGRRKTMFGMSCWALVSATISVTSQTRSQIMAARILNYLYIGVELSVAPIFQSEIVPAEARGLAVGTYQLSISLGGLVINSVCYGTGHLTDSRAWRIPLGLFYIIPTIILSLILFVPESPRWLLQKNRVEEARDSLRKFREGVFSDEEIEHELQELQHMLEREKEQGRFREVFYKRNLRRTMIAVGVNFFQQAIGQAFGSQYGAVYVKSLGTINAQLFSLINSAVGSVVIIAVILSADRFGRRTFLMASSTLMFAAFITMGSLGLHTPITGSYKIGIVSCITIFAAAFGVGWGPLPYVVTTEVAPAQLRDQTSRVGFGVNVLMNFVVTFSIPYLLNAPYAALGSKVGFIFGSMSFLSLIFVYFAVPECKGKSLEQVDLLFQNGVKLRDFGSIDAASMMDAELVVGIQETVKRGDITKGDSEKV